MPGRGLLLLVALVSGGLCGTLVYWWMETRCHFEHGVKTRREADREKLARQRLDGGNRSSIHIGAWKA